MTARYTIVQDDGGRNLFETSAPASPTCSLCGARHEVTAVDREAAAEEFGVRTTAADALVAAHFRLEIAARSAAPFALRGRAAKAVSL